MKLIDFLREFQIRRAQETKHTIYELMKVLQDIQNDPKAYAPVGKLNS